MKHISGQTLKHGYFTVHLIETTASAMHPTWISVICGMQDLGLNGKRVAICGKGSISTLGFS
jgi:hypothetical protein